MYLNGFGVAKDARKAFAAFAKAAQNGDITAQYWLGFCYENGIGAQADLAQAKKWYTESAARGDAIAQPAIDALARLAQEGR